MSTDKKKHSIGINLILLGIVLITGVILFFGKKYLKILPYETTYEFKGLTDCFLGQNGRTYVIDDGKKSIIVVSKDNEYVFSIEGGSNEKSFYYASLVCDDLDGNIYVADVVCPNEGTKINSERIHKYNSKGDYLGIIYEINYEDGECPYQYGNIKSIEARDNKFYCLVCNNGNITQVEVSDDNSNAVKRTWVDVPDIFDTSYDWLSDRLIIATKIGEIIAFDNEGNKEILFNSNLEGILAAVSVTESGKIYFSDVQNKLLYEIDGIDIYTTQMETSFRSMDIQGDNYVTTDMVGVYRKSFGDDLATEKYFTKIKISNFYIYVLVWINAATFFTCLLCYLIRIIIGFVRNLKDKEVALRIVMIIVATVACSVTISALSIKTMTSKITEDNISNLSLFTNILEKEVDTNGLGYIKAVDDYNTHKYNRIKAPLDYMIEKGYEEGVYYYYIIYGYNESSIYVIMDFENVYTVNYPFCEMGDNVYSETIQKKETRIVENEVSGYGTWTFKLNPICDESGKVVALLEVGVSVDETARKFAELNEDIIFTTITAVIVIVMLILEMMFLLENRRTRKKGSSNPADFVPLRSMIFLMYLATSLQESFIAQLCNKLYNGTLPISDGVAITLPISAELFFAALSSLVSGALVKKSGTKSLMVTGTTISMLGYSICGFIGSYTGILIGKSLLGIGLGMVVVTANTLAALGESDEDKGKAFAGINAGLLAGITVGDGLGSIILTFSNYRTAYKIGIFIMVIAFTVAISSRSTKTNQAKDERSISFGKFMFNKRVLPFFLLILIPFMIMLSYREYFFPLYGEENGLSEVAIGRVFLFCGLLIIYLGPILGEGLIEKLGSKRAMIISSFVMLLNVGIFVIYPQFISAVIGVLILSINISFAYTCQYAYFASLSECEDYGEGNAMGVYSMMENIGQTVGPMIFGSVLILGYADGIKIIGAAFLSLFVFYMMFAVEKKEKRGKKNVR